MVEYKRGEVPKCTVFLVVSALTSHTMVLLGNLATSKMLHGLGSSSHGWSSIGLSLSTAMNEELDPAMKAVAASLASSIEAMTDIESSVDVMLSMSGSATDSALSGVDKSKLTDEKVQETKANIMEQVRKVVDDTLAPKLSAAVDRLVQTMDPALNQVQTWLSTFGPKLQSALEEFGTTMDRVQKVFDAIMAKFSPSTGTGEKEMLYNTYTLFDLDKSGKINVDDVRAVAAMYGISALQGNKAAELFEKYDANGKGGLDKEEYALFVNDPSLTGIMPLMLREYSHKLSVVAGSVGSSSMRDEAAAAVVEYLSLVCAKNATKITWVSQALTNGTVPVEFTADVLKELAAMVDNPNDLTLVDVGKTVVDEMIKHGDTLEKALVLLADPAFWDSEGFDPSDQPAIVGRVVEWLAQTSLGKEAARQALGLPGVPSMELNTRAQELVKSRMASYSSETLSNKESDDEQLYSGNMSRVLRAMVLGGNSAAKAGDSKEADSAVKRGQPARPESLRFCDWLAANASQTAARHIQECFDYEGKSSGTLQSIAKQVTTIIKKTTGFINTMEMYSTPKGMQLFKDEVRKFKEEGPEDILLVVEKYVDQELAAMQCAIADGQSPACAEAKGSLVTSLDNALDLSGAFTFVTTTLIQLKTVLPVVVDDLKYARKAVVQVSKSLHNIMQILGLKAPPTFYSISDLYKTLWSVYFVFFALLTLAVLFYAFWASGFFGGPAPASAEEGYEAPRTFRERLRVCYNCCCSCFKGCTDSNLTFWSLIVLFEIIVLVVFVVSVVISLVGGLEMFMGAGCASVYILGNESICTSALIIVHQFLNTFWSSKSDALDNVCNEQDLLTCKLIADNTALAVKVAMVGGLLSAVLSFQMIVESAILHERSRWRLMLDAEAKKP